MLLPRMFVRAFSLWVFNEVTICGLFLRSKEIRGCNISGSKQTTGYFQD